MSLIPNDGGDTATTDHGSQDATQTSQDATQTTQENTDPVPAKYMYADGIEGIGDKPEWFKSEKYKTISDQAAAYKDLETRFGSFQGAPKDGYKIEGVNFEEDALASIAAKWGAEHQLSNEGLESLIKDVREFAQKQVDEEREASMKDLGDNANRRLADLAAWGRNNLSPSDFEEFQSLAQNAKQVQLLEKMIGMTKNSKLIDKRETDTHNNREDREAELKAMYTATNDKGQRLMEIDPQYRKKVTGLMKEFYGE